MIKLFHCADIHLDAPFSGTSPSEAHSRRSSLLKRFTDMMDYASDCRVDMVLIPGDLFDSDFVRPDTSKLISDAFEKLKCPVIIAPGNHDPYTPDSIYKTVRFPKNVHIFDSEEITRLDFDDIGISVFGYAFTSKVHAERPLANVSALGFSDKNINILCAHTDIYSGISPYAPISPEELSASGFAYAALGHVHNQPKLVLYGKTYTAYSGFAEGRGFDECGEGGAWLVTITNAKDTKVTAERVCRGDSRYRVVNIDITGADCDPTSTSMISKQLSDSFGQALHPELSLRIVLSGDIAMDYSPSIQTVSELLHLPCSVEIKDNTSPLYNSEYLEKDMTVKGEFYRMLAPVIAAGSPEEKRRAALALRYGFAAMSGQDIVID